MSAMLRLILLLLVLGGVSWFVYEVFQGASEEVPDPTAVQGGAGGGATGSVAGGTGGDPGSQPMVFTSSAQCAECHPAIYAEWKASYHGQAWTDPEYQELRTQENSQDCIPCHAPKPAYLTGFGNRFLARYDRRGEGVDCFTCHMTEKGMIGPIPDPDPAPCNPVFDPRIRQMDLCYPCHNQHDTHIEWQASSFFQEGKDCNSCHMPPLERVIATGGKVRRSSSHAFPGGHDFEYVRSGVEFSARMLGEDEEVGTVFQGPFGVDELGSFLRGVVTDSDGGEPVVGSEGAKRLVVEVANTGVGHNFPTDSRNNTVDIKLVFFSEEGVESRRYFVDRFRNPYRNEYKKNKTNTQIPSGARRRYVVELPEMKGAVEAQLIYKSGPYKTDEESEVLFSERISF